jgi:hypothetical protein
MDKQTQTFEDFHAKQFGWEITRPEHYEDVRVKERYTVWKAATKASGAEHLGELVRAANKVIKRWDSPQWTWDIHTGVYIHELRDAIAKLPPELRGES